MSNVSMTGRTASAAPDDIACDHGKEMRLSGPDEEQEQTTNDPKSSQPKIAPSDTTKASRRRFTLEDKRRILRLADGCSDQAQLGALLRREGIYRCTLKRFLLEREGGASFASDILRSGKSAAVQHTEALKRQVALLERQNNALTTRLRKAEIVIDFQKKLSQLLALEMDDNEKPNNEKP